MAQIEVDGEVLGHLLIMQAKRGGSLSDQIEHLLLESDEQFHLPLEKPDGTKKKTTISS